MYDSSVYKGSVYEKPIDIFAYHKPGSLEYSKVLQFYKMFYRPSNMVISIVSHVPFQKFIEILNHSDFTLSYDNASIYEHKYLGYKVNSGEKSSEEFKLSLNNSQPFINCPYPVISYTPQYEPQYIIKKHKGLNTLHLVIGFRTCSQYSPDKYSLNLLKNILGGFMNARLFAILRTSNGLTYSSYANTSYYSILGDFSISIETDPAKVFVNKGIGKGVLPLLVDIIVDLQKHGVSKTELRIAKSNLKGSMTIEEESNDNACFYNGSKTILYDDCNINVNENIPHILSPDNSRYPNKPIKASRPDIFTTSYHDRYIKFYKDITQKDIHDAIKKYFKKSNMTLCILGEHIPNLKTIKSICDKIQ